MPTVVIHAPMLDASQKIRVTRSIQEVLLREGMASGPAAVVFSPETDQPTFGEPGGSVDPIPLSTLTRARRTQAELELLRERLALTLRQQGTLTTLQARELLGLSHCDWAPATLRRLFGELTTQGLAEQRGLKRSTHYSWRAQAS